MSSSLANTPLEYSTDWFENVNLNLSAMETASKFYSSYRRMTDVGKIVWAFKAIQLTDLTTLAGDDTLSNVRRLCFRAAYPFTEDELKTIEKDVRENIHTAAVCVYPSHVKDAFEALSKLNFSDKIHIAAVASGFPSGQYSLKTRLDEIQYAIAQGANEIDIVIDRSLVLCGEWKQLYDQIFEMRKVCGTTVHMKTILGVGECGTFENVYKASMVAMLAGSDFIKTSTGKESVNATLPIGLVMIRAIQDYSLYTGRKIGLKPAGGIKNLKDAINWMTLIKSTLSDEWLHPSLFRFGASGLLDDIVNQTKAFLGDLSDEELEV